MPKRRGLSLLLSLYLSVVFAVCPVLRTACAEELEAIAEPMCVASEDFCPRSQTCQPSPGNGAPSCPSSQAPSSSGGCRACTLGTVEEPRAGERAPQREDRLPSLESSTPVSLASVTVTRRIDVRTASPPIHLLDVTFRN